MSLIITCHSYIIALYNPPAAKQTVIMIYTYHNTESARTHNENGCPTVKSYHVLPIVQL